MVRFSRILPPLYKLSVLGGLTSVFSVNISSLPTLTENLQLGSGQTAGVGVIPIEPKPFIISNASLPVFTNFPEQSQTGQYGTNRCGTSDSQSSNCQTLYINSLDDFCLWAPPQANSTIGDTESQEVAWCLKIGHGARIIPANTLTSAHFVKTINYIQITGTLNKGNLNLASTDQGGELDPHGATGLGNPIGAMVLTSAFGGLQQVEEWTQFIGAGQFCIRACLGSNAGNYCNHIYDVMGCNWNMPANYTVGIFESCQGAQAQPMGLYPPVTIGIKADSVVNYAVPSGFNNTIKPLPTLTYGTNQSVYSPMPQNFVGWSQFYQGQIKTPGPGFLAPSSDCTSTSTLGLQSIVSSAPKGSSANNTSTAMPQSVPSPSQSGNSKTETNTSGIGNGKQPSSASSTLVDLKWMGIWLFVLLV